jgi:hypothetical protein
MLGYDSGCIYLNYGNHLVFVPTCICPNEVWTKITGKGTDGCCQIPMNEVGHMPKHNGIIFSVDVKTDTAVVEWFATR